MTEKVHPDQLKPMTSDEREALAKKLDKDLEEYLDKLESSATSKYKVRISVSKNWKGIFKSLKLRIFGLQDGWSEESWETEMESHPFFATTLNKEKTDNEVLTKLHHIIHFFYVVSF